MKNFIIVALCTLYGSVYSQKSGIITYRAFYTETQLTEEFKKKDGYKFI